MPRLAQSTNEPVAVRANRHVIGNFDEKIAATVNAPAVHAIFSRRTTWARRSAMVTVDLVTGNRARFNPGAGRFLNRLAATISTANCPNNHNSRNDYIHKILIAGFPPPRLAAAFTQLFAKSTLAHATNETSLNQQIAQLRVERDDAKIIGGIATGE